MEMYDRVTPLSWCQTVEVYQRLWNVITPVKCKSRTFCNKTYLGKKQIWVAVLYLFSRNMVRQVSQEHFITMVTVCLLLKECDIKLLSILLDSFAQSKALCKHWWNEYVYALQGLSVVLKLK